MTDEMGKTLTDGRAEVEKCAFHCDWFAENSEAILGVLDEIHRDVTPGNEV